MIGRRGPAYAKFTTKELRELGELAGVEVVVYGRGSGLGHVRRERDGPSWPSPTAGSAATWS